jgi:hypothetical protein
MYNSLPVKVKTNIDITSVVDPDKGRIQRLSGCIPILPDTDRPQGMPVRILKFRMGINSNLTFFHKIIQYTIPNVESSVQDPYLHFFGPPGSGSLVRGMDPDPSIIKQK